MLKDLIENQIYNLQYNGSLTKICPSFHSTICTEEKPKALDVKAAIKHHNQIPKNQEKVENWNQPSSTIQTLFLIPTPCWDTQERIAITNKP